MTPDRFSVLECRNCHALFINPFPNQEQTSKFYPQNYYSYEISNHPKGFFENLKKKIIDYHTNPKAKFNFFDKILILIFKNKFSGVPLYRKEGGKFLDIGCGSGANLKTVKEYGWKAYGIELDEKAVTYAKRSGLDVECVSLEKAIFPTKFDSIRIWHVFEHLTNPNESIKKISEILDDDGEILMAIPNSNSWAKKIFKKYWYSLDIPRHIIIYSPETLNQILKNNNLKIKELKFASCGSFVGSISNFLKFNFGYNGNLINNIFLISIFSIFDYLSDIFKKGDTIFITINKIN
jgi:2-polyprenyl-3-methyl-5-hydroxy-6-metoxy-1,4-benzoquinol methylase